MSELANSIAAGLAGFSITSAFILMMAYWFFLPLMKKNLFSKLVCTAVLGCLMALQSAHFYYFQTGEGLLSLRSYISLLIFIPLSFYLFSRYVLFQEEKLGVPQLVHFVLPVSSFFMPVQVVPSLAFTLGTFYTIWLVSRLYLLREERSRFVLEMAFFLMFALMAASALLLGLFLPFMDHDWFYLTYSLSISLAMIAVVSALLIFPQLLEDVVAIAERAYSTSKLQSIDREEKLKQLQSMMERHQAFRQEDISLSMLANRMDLSTHQLSELINVSYGKNFPRLIREYRVEAARQQLMNEPESSMLAIGLDIGFKSQSAFYTAFKEITGMSPGIYRKLNQA